MDLIAQIVLPLLAGCIAGAAVYFLVRTQSDARLGKLFSSLWADRALDLTFICLASVLGLTYAALDFGKYRAFNVYGIDFALFDQVIWNTLHGRLLENTIVGDAPILLAQRFSPILFAFAPLYAFFSDPRLLAVTPALAVTVATFPLYWFARRRVGRPLGLVIAVAFLTAPGLQFIALDQFKEIMMAIPLLMFATTFLLQRRYVPFFVCLALAMMCKEEVGFIAAAFGVYILFVHRRYVLGAALAVFGVAWVLFLIQVVIPHFQGSANYYYFGGSGYYGSGLYDYLGHSASEIVTTALTRPDIVLQNLLTSEKIDAIVKIGLPLGVLAWLGLDVVLLALPTLGYTLLSDRRAQFLFGSWHYSPVYVFLFLGLVIGLERLIKWSRFHFDMSPLQSTAARAALGAFILVSSAGSYYWNAVGPLAKYFDQALYTPTTHDQLGAALADSIPQDAAVLAQTELVSHLAERRYLYVDVGEPCLSGMDYIFADSLRPWYTYREQDWQKTLNSGWFETVVQKDGYILQKRLPSLNLTNRLGVRFGADLTLVGYTLPLTDTVVGGQGLTLLTGWQTGRESSERYVMQFSVYDSQGHLWSQVTREPCRGIRPTSQWIPGQINYDDSGVGLPVTMPPGNYRITASVHSTQSDNALEAHDSLGHSLGGEIELASIQVTKNKASFTASDIWIEQRLYVDMNEMRLLGYKPIPPEARAGDVLPVGLYWRARAKPRGDYVAVVELRDEDGHVAAEHDARPANGAYPTTDWNVGEVLLDWHDVLLPEDMAPGAYQVVALMKDGSTGEVFGEATIGTLQVVR